MRPLKLTMQAFGSYGKQTEINFQKAEQNLFLITGDTGAGKTTIFDAIVFALYGEASSGLNKKEGVVLQSQYVEMNVEPFVELTFSEGAGEIYTVRRVPRHLKLLTRGAGKNTATREVTGSVSLTMPDGTEYPPKESDKKLEEILGLTKNQFMQVAMIAQGEFMELLRAKSDDKKVIFRKLFNTELYQDIVEELMNRKRGLEKEIAQIRTVCQTEAAHVVIPQEYAEVQELEALQKQIRDGEIVVMEQFLPKLGELCETLEKEGKAAAKELEKASQFRDEKRDLYTNSRQLQGLFAQKEAAEESLKECQEEAPRRKEQEILVGKIRSAYEVKGEYTRYQDAKNSVENGEKALKEQLLRMPELEKNALSDGEKEKLAKEQADQELKNFTEVSQQVKKELELYEKIGQVQKEKKKNQELLEKAQDVAQKTKAASAELEKKEEKWREQAEKLSDIKARVALWQGKMQENEKLEADAREMEKSRKRAELQQAKTQKLKLGYAKVSQEYEGKNQKYESMRRIFLDEQAGFLAKELVPGKPCPVCGALDHPHPCGEAFVHLDFTKEDLELLEKEVSQLRESQTQLSAEARSAADLAVELDRAWKDALAKLLTQVIGAEYRSAEEARLAETKGQLVQETSSVASEGQPSQETTPAAPVHEPVEAQEDVLKARVQEVLAILAAQKNKLQEERAVLQKAEKKYAALQDALGQMDDAKARAKAAVEETTQKLTQAAAAVKGSQVLLEELENSRIYKSKEAANEEYQKARITKEQAGEAYQKAKENASASAKAFHDCQTLIHRYQLELPEQKELCENRKKGYLELLKDKKITEEQWQEICETHPQSAADELQSQIDSWKQKKTASQAAKEAAEEAIQGRELPDFDKVQEEMEQAMAALSQAQEKLDLCKERYKTDQEAYNRLAPKMQERGKIIENHARLENLYRLLSGNVSGNRMDLETFVQRYYLEKILYAANRRFSHMSAGQFELRMVDAASAGKGKNRGLDLMVYSNVTGKEREVRTLSGGESFMAALALALGMADQIQESSAAVNLDVMFVDEGFGSLDEHSREQAVKVLQELAGGRKLIGIISHVTELKQEIEDQLLVSKDEKGSHVSWQIS